MNKQLGLPAVEPGYLILEVTVAPAVHRLKVDADEWEVMDEQERKDFVYAAAEELDWFKTSYVVEGQRDASESQS